MIDYPWLSLLTLTWHIFSEFSVSNALQFRIRFGLLNVLIKYVCGEALYELGISMIYTTSESTSLQVMLTYYVSYLPRIGTIQLF